MFDVIKGTRLTRANMKAGSIRYIGASTFNNGITAYIANDEHLHPANTISVSYNGSVGVAFYQDEPFWASDDVNILYPKFPLTQNIALFLIPIIQRVGTQYAFIDKWKKEDMERDKIKLPVDKNGVPDFQYMETYIDLEIKKTQMFIQEIAAGLSKNRKHIEIQHWGSFRLGDLFDIVKGSRLTKADQIKNQTKLSYISGTANESLPSSHNGLGYKNLIKMEFLLAAFAKDVEKRGVACIPLLFIEEPESHMHPQMQTAFASYLEKFLGKLSTVQIQTFLTSHSAHIANTMEFAKVRYAQKSNDGVIYKNLNTFAQANPNNVDFIRKYLTLTKCDLFFADKAIFVEGASERLLLPDMIEKCEKSREFGHCKYPLSAQYYALIEIGGAYAYKFIPFIEFLGVPCLILTDLDSVADRKGRGGKIVKKSVVVSEGETTSNETIKWWVRKNKGLPDNDTSKIGLSEIISMTADDKTRGKCHIEFQTTEKGLCGHSLEEAIRNVNRKHYNLGNRISEKKLEFTGKSKTDFALDLIYKYSDYCVPDYIKSGLKWLNDQRVLE